MTVTDTARRQSVRRYDQEGLTMTTITIENVKMSIGAARNAEQTGTSPRADVARVRAGLLSRDELLTECLDGCDDEQTAADWREYVDAIVVAASVPVDVDALLRGCARDVAKDNECDLATAVRMMRDESGQVALDLGLTDAEVAEWCDIETNGYVIKVVS